MEKRPRIALSMDHTARPERAVLRDAYYEAVWAAGGMPVLIAPLLESRFLETALSGVDALVMPGADDYHPSLWGEARLDPRCVLVTPRRQEADLRIVRIALQLEIPLLAICGSMQLLNVACGGSVRQHIEERASDAMVAHRSRDERPARHPVRVDPRSRLCGWVGCECFEVNSYHHQACERLAPGWRAVAWAEDGIVEAIEPVRRDLTVLGVQWHPEKIVDEPTQRAIFEGICEAARKRRRRFERG